jgi:hypothetical protein
LLTLPQNCNLKTAAELGVRVKSMSFNSEANIVKDSSMSIGLRYISMRHCVQMFCPIGFNKTWSFLEIKAGIKENQENSSEVLVKAIEVLSEWRSLHIQKKRAEWQYIQWLVKNGFPKNSLAKQETLKDS